jgi:hypothetical protein
MYDIFDEQHKIAHINLWKGLSKNKQAEKKVEMRGWEFV